jgi:hypothetical protein
VPVLLGNIKTFLINNKNTILYIILGIILYCGLVLLLVKEPQIPKEYKEAIEILNKSNADLIIKQKQLDSIISIYDLEIKQLDYRIDNIKSKTTIVNQYYSQQSTAVGKYTPIQVDSFFKSRYKY